MKTARIHVLIVGVVCSALCCVSGFSGTVVEQWGMYEVTLKGPTNGNPFLDVRVGAKFKQGNDQIEVSGFYDGDGNYRVRFSPGKRGAWRYETTSSVSELNRKTGEFTVTMPSADRGEP